MTGVDEAAENTKAEMVAAEDTKATVNTMATANDNTKDPRPQYQVERHMRKKEEEYELVDFRLRREPIPWEK